MKGTSKVIMGATLVMVVSLAIVLALVLVLLAELYCSLLLRRRRLRITSPANTTTSTTTIATATPTVTASSPEPSLTSDQSATPISRFYSHGVLHAPRCFLFPAVPCKENKVETNTHHSHLPQVLEGNTPETNTSPRRTGNLSSPPPSTSFISSPQPIKEISIQITSSSSACNDKARGGEHFVYISNPIYDNDGGRQSREDTPFETPDTSPSRLESCTSSGDDDEEEVAQPSPSSPHMTPPLSPMKKLPAEACSISLRDARSLGTSGSDSMSNNGLSSSSSGSPCTSPSW